jgi:hypothetical protein
MRLRYIYSLHERVARFLIDCDAQERVELLRFFDSLANDPGRKEDEAVIDNAGRRNEVAYSEHFRIIFWADHAEKEIRIMDARLY